LRLAYRLFHRAGELDVDAMRERMTPEQFDGWVAYMAVEGDPWLRMIEVMRNGFCILANAWISGGKIEPHMIDPWYEEPKADEAATASDLSAIGLG
jgi:hypothetical protein